jgi:cell division protein FtsB
VIEDMKKLSEASTKKDSQDKNELKTLLGKLKKENDELRNSNKKLDGDVRRLMEALNKKNVSDSVSKKDKIILESLSARVNELE